MIVGCRIAAPKVGKVRVAACETSGAGGMMFVARVLAVRLGVDPNPECNSGEGGTTLIAGRVGAMRVERRPSAGGGPGVGLKRGRLGIGEKGRGRFSLGAST